MEGEEHWKDKLDRLDHRNRLIGVFPEDSDGYEDDEQDSSLGDNETSLTHNHEDDVQLSVDKERPAHQHLIAVPAHPSSTLVAPNQQQCEDIEHVPSVSRYQLGPSLEDEYNRLLGEDIMKSRTLQQNMLELNQLRLNVKFLRASNKEYENGRITALAEKHMVDMERTRLQEQLRAVAAMGMGLADASQREQILEQQLAQTNQLLLEAEHAKLDDKHQWETERDQMSDEALTLRSTLTATEALLQEQRVQTYNNTIKRNNDRITVLQSERDQGKMRDEVTTCRTQIAMLTERIDKLDKEKGELIANNQELKMNLAQLDARKQEVDKQLLEQNVAHDLCYQEVTRLTSIVEASNQDPNNLNILYSFDNQKEVYMAQEKKLRADLAHAINLRGEAEDELAQSRQKISELEALLIDIQGVCTQSGSFDRDVHRTSVISSGLPDSALRSDPRNRSSGGSSGGHDFSRLAANVHYESSPNISSLEDAHNLSAIPHFAVTSASLDESFLLGHSVSPKRDYHFQEEQADDGSVSLPVPPSTAVKMKRQMEENTRLMNQLEQENEQLRETNAELQRMQESVNASHAPPSESMVHLQEQCNALELERQYLQTELAMAHANLKELNSEYTTNLQVVEGKYRDQLDEYKQQVTRLNHALSSMANEVNSAGVQIAKLTAQLSMRNDDEDTARAQLNDLQVELKECQAARSKLEGNVLVHEQEIGRLTALIAQLQSDNASQQASIAALKDLNQILESTHESHTGLMSMKDEEINDLGGKITNLMHDMTAHSQASLNMLEGEKLKIAQEHADRIHALQEDVDKHRDEARQLLRTLHDHKHELEELRALAAAREAAGHEQQIADLVDQLRSKEDELEALMKVSGDVQSARNELTALQEDIVDRTDQLADLNKSIVMATTQLPSVTFDLSLKTAELSTLEAACMSASNQLTALRAELHNAEAEVNDRVQQACKQWMKSDGKLIDLTRQCSDKEDILMRLDSILQLKNQAMAALETKALELTANIGILAKQHAELNGNWVEADQHFQRARADALQQETQLTTLSTSVQEQTARLSTVIVELSAKAAALSSIEAAIALRTEQQVEIDSKVSAGQEELATISARIHKAKADHLSALEAVAKVVTEHDQLQQEHAQLLQKLSTSRSTAGASDLALVESTKDRLTSLQADIAMYSSKMHSSQLAYQEVTVKLQAANDEVGSKAAELAALQANITTANSTLNSLLAEQSSCKVVLNSLNDNINVSKLELSNLQAQIAQQAASHKLQLINIEASTAAHADLLAEIKASTMRHDDLQARLSTAQEEYARFQSQVGSLSQATSKLSSLADLLRQEQAKHHHLQENNEMLRGQLAAKEVNHMEVQETLTKAMDEYKHCLQKYSALKAVNHDKQEEVDKLTKQIKDLQRSLADAEAKYEILQSNSSAVHVQTKVLELQNTIVSLQGRVAELQDQLEFKHLEWKAKKKSIRSGFKKEWDAQEEKFTQKIARLEKMYQAKASEKSGAHVDIHLQAVSVPAETDKLVNELQSQVDLLTTSLSELQDKHRSLEADHRNLQLSLSNSNHNNETLQTQRISLQEEHLKMKVQLQEYEEKCHKLELELEQWQSKHRSLHAEYTVSLQQNKESAVKNSQMSHEIEDLREQMSALTADRDSSMMYQHTAKQLADMTLKHSALQEQFLDLQEHYQELNATYELSQRHVNTYNRRVQTDLEDGSQGQQQLVGSPPSGGGRAAGVISKEQFERGPWILRADQNSATLSVNVVTEKELKEQLQKQKEKLSAKLSACQQKLAHYQEGFQNELLAVRKEYEDDKQLLRKEMDERVAESIAKTRKECKHDALQFAQDIVSEQLVREKDLQKQKDQIRDILLLIDSSIAPALIHLPSLRTALQEVRRLRDTLTSAQTGTGVRSSFDSVSSSQMPAFPPSEPRISPDTFHSRSFYAKNSVTPPSSLPRANRMIVTPASASVFDQSSALLFPEQISPSRTEDLLRAHAHAQAQARAQLTPRWMGAPNVHPHK